MPYYIHPKDVDIATADIWDLPTFDTAASANAAIADRSTHKVSFRASTDETMIWRAREMSRYSNGEYTEVPWCDKYGDHLQPDHFAHLSVKTPGLIAFTKSIEHGVQDRQTSMRPGRYLQEFYAGQFDIETVAEYIGACAAEHMTLQIARSVDDVVSVYSNAGITSCMDGNHFRTPSRHPCRVYGDSDLGVAYYGPIDDIRARAVVWPDKHIYSRLYGNGDVLESLLKSAGYRKGDFEGARIRCIESNGRYVIPYIDYIDGADDTGDGYLVLGEGSINCQSTDGYAEDTNNTRCCQGCNGDYEADENGDCGYCSSCEDDRTSCDTCGNDIWFSNSDHVILQNGNNICERCADRLRIECSIDDCDETWINDEVFTTSEQRARTANHMSDICQSCAETTVYCEHCEEIIDTETIDDGRCECGHAFRCDRTADLPLSPMDEPCHDNSTWHGPDMHPPVAWDDPTNYNNTPHNYCCARDCFNTANHDLGTSDQGCAAHYNTPTIAHLITQNGVDLCESPF